MARGEREFAREEANFAAQTTLQELDATRQLISNKTSARTRQFQAKLNEQNLQANIASQLAGGATNAFAANAKAQAELAAQEAVNRGSFIANLITTAAPIVGGLFGGPAGAAAGAAIGGTGNPALTGELFGL